MPRDTKKLCKLGTCYLSFKELLIYSKSYLVHIILMSFVVHGRNFTVSQSRGRVFSTFSEH